MTVSSQTNNETFNGNGVTVVWDLPFRFFDNSEIVVNLIDPALGTSTLLVLGTDYTLSGAGLPEQFGTAPGKITTTVPVDNLKDLYVVRLLQAEQLTDIVNQGRFFPEVHEDVFDRLTMLIQQVQSSQANDSKRAVRVPGIDAEIPPLPSASLRANKLLTFDASGNPVATTPNPGSSVQLAIDLRNAIDADKGASMIGYGGGANTVRQFLDRLSESANAANGAGMIGYQGSTLSAYITGKTPRIVNNITDMRNCDTNLNKYFETVGRITPRDGGSGFYMVDDTDTTTPADGGSVFITNDGTNKRIKLVDPMSLANVIHFGAVPGATDSSSQFQNAINALGTARIPAAAAGFTAGNLILAANQKLIADSKVELRTTAAHSWGAKITAFGIGTYAFIEGVRFNLAASTTAIPAILAATALGSVFGLRVNNVDFVSCGAAYAEEVHATNWVVDAYFKDCLCYFTRGLQFYSRRSRGFFTLRDFKVDHTYNPGQVTWGGLKFEDLIGLELEKVDVVGPVQPSAVYQAAAVGITITGIAGSASVWLRRVLVDNTRGPGIAITGIHNVFGVDTCIYQNLGPPLVLTNVNKSLFTNTKIVGGIGLPAAPAASNGLSMDTCTSVTFMGLEIESNTGDGITQVSCTDCNIIGGYSNSNTGYGCREVTASTRNLRMGMRMLSNTAGSLLQIGAQSATTNWWANGGSFLPSTVGAITVP